MYQEKHERFIERHIGGVIVLIVYFILFGLDCILTA